MKNGELVAAVSTGKVSISKTLDNSTITQAIPKIPNIPDKNQTIVNEKGENKGGKVNPNTNKVETIIKETTTTTVKEINLDFTDINNLNENVKKSIKYLRNQGKINGRTATTFDPNAKITRAEFSSMLLFALSKDNPVSDNGGFKDVKSSDWYYATAGTSKKLGYVTGYEDNTFRPSEKIKREQLIAVSGRVIGMSKKYTSNDVASILNVFGDKSTISDWAKKDIAIMTQNNLYIQYKEKGKTIFLPKIEMTRAEAAVVICKIYERLY